MTGLSRFSLVLACLIATGARAAEVDAAAVAEKVGPSVFRLGFFRGDEAIGNGTGFVIRKDGVLVTNHHVVAGTDAGAALVAIDRLGVKHKVLGLLADDEDHDLALIKIEGGDYAPLALADGASLQVGQTVLLIGSSYGLDQSLGVGVISALRDGFPEEMTKAEKKAGEKVTLGPIVQHTATSTHGASGSPVVNVNGEVIAVEHSGLDGTGISFAAHVDLVRALVARSNLDAAPKPLGPNIARNLAISGAVFGVPLLAFLIVRVVLRIRAARAKKKPRVVAH